MFLQVLVYENPNGMEPRLRILPLSLLPLPLSSLPSPSPSLPLPFSFHSFHISLTLLVFLFPLYCVYSSSSATNHFILSVCSVLPICTQQLLLNPSSSYSLTPSASTRPTLTTATSHWSLPHLRFFRKSNWICPLGAPQSSWLWLPIEL